MIGQTISHYRIVGKLGEGGMGVVYKAEDTRLDRTVALKFLGAHLVADEDGRRRFIREAKAAASLDHPNICTVYEIDEAEGKVFMAMACIEGRNLTDAISGGPMKLPEALDIARQTARGLQEAHAKGIVHRDIKPANIMISTTGSGERLIKVMDFGLAQLAGVTKLTRADTTIGTIAYMSPEQTQGIAVDHRSDIWSLGAVLYEMITAQQAFKGHYDQAVMYSILNEEPEPVTTLRSGVPMELEWILGKALAKTAERRYQSALEFAVDMETVLAKLQSGGSTMTRSAARVAPPGMPPAGVSPAGMTSEISPEIQSQQRRRSARELLLELGGQGLLPDRVLSQALDLLAKPPGQMLTLERRRSELLDALLSRQLRVGEFIEQWQHVETPLPYSVAAVPSTGPAASFIEKVEDFSAAELQPHSNVLAALCSFAIPGLGQLLQGRLRLALIQFGLATALWFILMGWIIHIWSTIDAAKFAPELQDRGDKRVERWQNATPSALPPVSADVSAAAEASPGWRTKAELFGWPLVHCVRGIDPRTGKRLVAKGIIAVGEIAVGVIACGGVALGILAVGGVSIGLLSAGGLAVGLLMSAGIVAVGPSPFGAAVLSVAEGSFWFNVVQFAMLFTVLRLLIRRKRFRKRYGDDGGAVSVWAIAGAREWRSDGTPFRGGNLVATLGACDVDLSETNLAGPEVAIEATAIFGGIKIIVPPGWRIVTQGSQFLGGYANKTRPPQFSMPGSAPRLVVKGFALFGGVEVVHPQAEASASR